MTITGFADLPELPKGAKRMAEEMFVARFPKEHRSKQVILVRVDLEMPVGKLAAQVGHAAVAFDTSEREYFSGSHSLVPTDEEIDHWVKHSFRKICLAVDSEEELLDLHEQALEAGLRSHLITDNGTTVFNGEHTHTCVGIGPNWDDKINEITCHLRLL